MKKLVKVLLAVLLSLTFFGCQQQPKTKEVKIGVAIYQFNDNFSRGILQDSRHRKRSEAVFVDICWRGTGNHRKHMAVPRFPDRCTFDDGF